MFSELLIKHCSPTLAGIKTGNIFNFFADSPTAERTICKFNKKLNPFGIYIAVLNQKQSSCLVYVYRKNLLEADLKQADISNFISAYGYNTSNVELAIQKLKHRITEVSSFPHEIGVFLSYPLDDIKGFIIHKGCNCKCTGCWKVYHNEESAQEIFALFEHCTNVYCQLYQDIKDIERLLAI